MNRGFSLIEVMVGIAFMCILVALGLGVTGQTTQGITYGINGLMETRCVDGYKVLVGEKGHPIQMIDAQGRGIQCNVEARLNRDDK